MGSGGRNLVAVLCNPPLTAGVRTLHRVRLAAQLLSFEEVQVANLFALPSHSTNEIATLGASHEGWAAARTNLQASLDASDGVLLAYGCTSPTGPARHNLFAQVEWLSDLLGTLGRPAWQVGDAPRHPSRWQRWTCRAHPELTFPDALRASLARYPSDASCPEGSGWPLFSGPMTLSWDRTAPQDEEGRHQTCRSAN